MKSRIRFGAGIALVVGSILAGTAGIAIAGSHKDRTVLEADSLAAVTAPYTGVANAIRGVPGGGAPWVIASGEVELKASGKVEAEVRGLVIDPAFPNPAVAGINPVPMMKITVSCLTTDATGAAVTMNVSTDPQPIGTDGTADFAGMVSLPSPCFAPIVFIANGAGNGAWFAVTGA